MNIFCMALFENALPMKKALSAGLVILMTTQTGAFSFSKSNFYAERKGSTPSICSKMPIALIILNKDSRVLILYPRNFPRRFPRSPPLFPLSPASFRTGRGEKLGRGSFVCNSAASSKMGDAVFGFVGLTVAEICRGMSPGLYTLHYFDLKPLFSST